MNKQTRTPQQACSASGAEYYSYVRDCTDEFLSGLDTFAAIRLLRRLRREWIKPEAAPLLFEHLHAIESLLIDFADAEAKYHLALLTEYEQAPD